MKWIEADGSFGFSYKDESSKVDKRLSLRVGVDICQKMTYNPDDSIVVIKIKRMSV